MKNYKKRIIPINIDEELKQSYLGYAMSVIIGRALPDIRDGLKPVHRRILFAMYELGNYWNKPYKKSARIVGDVIGKYHPHGDTAVYDTIVRMAQSFSMRYMLIDGQGNFGSIDGDSAAAMRYTEIRMEKIAHELLADLEKNTVDFIQNYDGTEKIISIMPTKIPNLLINGASGIAVGMATNIPPHNLSEVINACLALIKDKHISVEKLMKYIPGPDFPTSAIINGQSGIKQAYENGKGKIFIRARAYIKIDQKTKKEIIIINEIPYQVNKSKLIEKIFELVRDKKIEGISNIRDESDKDGMRIVIEIKRDSSGEIVLNNLYLSTQLQISFNINMVALYKGKPKILSLKEILNSFINHRKEIIIRRTIFDLEKSQEKIHIIEGLIIAICNISSIIEIIKSSSSVEESKEKLMSNSWKIEKIDNNFIIKYLYKENTNTNFLEKIQKDRIYFFTEKQTKSILNLRLQRLTSLENEKLLEEYKVLLTNISYLEKILKSSNQLYKIICKELIDIKKQYGDKRRTEILINESNVNVEDLIHQEDVVVTLSYQGYVKYQPLIDYETQKRGGKGKSAASIKEEDFIHKILVANTHDNILFFSNYGKIFSIKTYQLPESSREARGRPIVNLLKLEKNERITAIFSIKNYYKKSLHIFMATTSGIVKKTSLSEFKRLCHTGIIAISLNKNDELVGVDLTNGNNEIMLFSSYGKVVKFHESEVRNMRRTAIGVKGMNLLKGDKIVSLIVPKSNEPILTVTKHGYGKRTEYIEYPIKSRATQGVISIRASKRNGEVVGAVQVKEKDQVMIITDVGTLVRIRVSDINIVKRNTQGVILIRTAKNENVVGLQRIDDFTSL